MQQIQEILAQQGIQAADREIEALINELGANPEQLTEAEVQAIAEELISRKQSTALATAKPKSGKVAKSPVKGRKQVKEVGIDAAIAHAATVSNQEITSFAEVIRAGAEQYAEAMSEDLINEVRNVPTKVVEKFVNRAMGESADTESFRAVGQTISQGLFGNFATNEAV